MTPTQSARAFHSRENETEDALLFFYKNLGQALKALTSGPPNSRRETWARAKTILHFFCLDFQPQDCDLILGSGTAFSNFLNHPLVYFHSLESH
jgi:hypothetical protein